MKILILSSYAPSLLYFREDMIKSIQNKGYEVIAAAPDAEVEWKDKFDELNIRYISISYLERNGTSPLKDILGFFSIMKIILQENPDKVIAYQAKTIIYGSVAAKLSKVKEVYALIGGLGSVIRETDKSSIAKKILKVEYKTAFKFCNKVFFQNKDDVQEVKNMKLIKEDKVVMINGSGVNLEKFRPTPMPEETTFLFIGRIIKDKGVLEYIEAAKIVKKKYPKAKVQIVGYFDTNPTSVSEKKIQSYVNDEIIEYLGSTEDVRPFLKNSSVFVLPSYHEGTPKSVLEAMAIGRPIITTDAPGCRETVINGLNGFLVPVKNEKLLAKKMIWMIENPREREAMAKESLRICEDKFDVNKVNNVILSTIGL